MSGDSVRVLLAMDPEHGVMRVLLNAVPAGTVVNAGGQFALNLDPQFAHLRDELVSYCGALFANMPETLRAGLYEASAFLTNTAGRDASAALKDDRKRLVHLGCGPDVRPGWLNIDYKPGGAVGYDAAAGFLNYDLRQGLPEIATASVDVFFSSHFFEHVNPQEAMNLMRECRRALRSDGMARFQMPDFKQTFRAYVDDDQAFLDKALNYYKLLDKMPDYARNYADLVSQGVYESYTHKYIWDPENLSKALIVAGFGSVEEVDFDPEFDNPAEGRRDYSYYLLARP
ncbi:class I SAM-dependent methyltransferase [Phenylobacterium sp.]|jgi:predicted SAM-dependent methyltransferase|uniref:class I SAM-dependent methyltransferase n=1 Tax=Phenylobacterium sp. TaxID=1871053 RepID=UPI002E37F5B6|nr:methyltransferase domain-containing protein [Phenylobacterium sp.]HEX4712760.1 methyltransferase domain-containing protein [Phenylobacterium sp.]